MRFSSLSAAALMAAAAVALRRLPRTSTCATSHKTHCFWFSLLPGFDWPTLLPAQCVLESGHLWSLYFWMDAVATSPARSIQSCTLFKLVCKQPAGSARCFCRAVFSQSLTGFRARPRLQTTPSFEHSLEGLVQNIGKQCLMARLSPYRRSFWRATCAGMMPSTFVYECFVPDPLRAVEQRDGEETGSGRKIAIRSSL